MSITKEYLSNEKVISFSELTVLHREVTRLGWDCVRMIQSDLK